MTDEQKRKALDAIKVAQTARSVVKPETDDKGNRVYDGSDLLQAEAFSAELDLANATKALWQAQDQAFNDGVQSALQGLPYDPDADEYWQEGHKYWQGYADAKAVRRPDADKGRSYLAGYKDAKTTRPDRRRKT